MLFGHTKEMILELLEALLASLPPVISFKTHSLQAIQYCLELARVEIQTPQNQEALIALTNAIDDVIEDSSFAFVRIATEDIDREKLVQSLRSAPDRA